ncbi:hypothetical protein ZIOFF_066582 [Zingiber officinale]|uniref:Bidirectional sugar transporter SWEET n=2 Tax=Zingiber officinale TaxID=94328 RepID=A0A8J5K7U0_ZINOF|nr:hypothetical protein ZIOFF_066582 [Zingiber officinale]
MIDNTSSKMVIEKGICRAVTHLDGDQVGLFDTLLACKMVAAPFKLCTKGSVANVASSSASCTSSIISMARTCLSASSTIAVMECVSHPHELGLPVISNMVIRGRRLCSMQICHSLFAYSISRPFANTFPQMKLKIMLVITAPLLNRIASHRFEFDKAPICMRPNGSWAYTLTLINGHKHDPFDGQVLSLSVRAFGTPLARIQKGMQSKSTVGHDLATPMKAPVETSCIKNGSQSGGQRSLPFQCSSSLNQASRTPSFSGFLYEFGPSAEQQFAKNIPLLSTSRIEQDFYGSLSLKVDDSDKSCPTSHRACNIYSTGLSYKRTFLLSFKVAVVRKIHFFFFDRQIKAMAGLSLQHPLPFAFGILGNIISFMVFLAPIPTFYRIYRKKSTEGFHSVPYVVSLFSCMLWIYYAFVKTDSLLLITINSFGLFIETTYITIYLIYAPKKARVFCIQIFLLLDVLGFAGIVLLTQLLTSGSKRVVLLGWICVGFSVSVFAAPLSVIRVVIRTKSVEFMPFFLSFFLTLSAIAWFGYGLFTKDIYVQLPNVLGFLFGVAQMLLYVVYKKKKNVVVEPTVPEHIVKIMELTAAPPSELLQSTALCNLKKVDENTEGGLDKAKGPIGEGFEIIPIITVS